MAITPQTVLRLVKVPLEIDNKNQLTFENEQKQREYFLSLPHKEIQEISYQRKNNVIMFPEHIDNLLEYNYVMYLNENYTNKWFYAFITNMEYETDHNTIISISTDVFQTWQFQFQFKESFIEREMINVEDDIPGANLLPEGLETGEFKVGGTAEFDDLEPINVVAYSGDKIQILEDTQEINLSQKGYIVNGIAQSIVFLLVDNDHFWSLQQAMTIGSQGDYVISCFTVPKLAVKDFLSDENKIFPFVYALQYKELKNIYNQSKTTKELISTPNNLDGYIPKNQKLRTYPYLYLGFNAINGSSKIFRYEDFENGKPIFDIMSEVNPNPTILFVPKNYRGSNGDNLSDIVTLNGYPTLSSKNDFYNSWLAQNSEIISLNMQQEQFNYEIGAYQTAINSMGNIISQASKGDLGALGTGANLGFELAKQDVNHDFYIKQQMAQIEKQKLLPDKVNMASSNSTLIGYGLIDKNIFTRYTIKNQFAERIDKFFDMYGYLTNNVKIPNLNNRPNWNYVKTIGSNIIGDIPQEDVQTLKNMFDNGITLWHNKDTFLDYSQNNR